MGQGSAQPGASEPQTPWQTVLTAINRKKLDPSLRPALDELMIDTLLYRDDLARLLDWLKHIPPEECSPRLQDAIETTAMSQFSRLVSDQSVPAAIDLWEQMVLRPWPASSLFPDQLTSRLAAAADAFPERYREPIRQRLLHAESLVSANPDQSARSAMAKSELTRLKALDSALGKSR